MTSLTIDTKVRNFKEKNRPERFISDTEENCRITERPHVHAHAAAQTANQERGPINNGYTCPNLPPQNSFAYDSFQAVPAQPIMQSQQPTGQFIIQHDGPDFMHSNNQSPEFQQFLQHNQSYVMQMQRNWDRS